MKELAELKKQNQDFLKPAVKRGVHHFAFRTVDNDYITVPFCGEQEDYKLITNQVQRTSCKDCLLRLKAVLDTTESYQEAADLLETMTPELPQPDKAVMAEKTAEGKSTIAARQERGKENFLKRRKLKGASAKEIVENIIGTNKETFYKNLIKLRAIDDAGEVKQSFISLINSRIETISKEE